MILEYAADRRLSSVRGKAIFSRASSSRMFSPEGLRENAIRLSVVSCVLCLGLESSHTRFGCIGTIHDLCSREMVR